MAGKQKRKFSDDISRFLSSEEGKIIKSDVVKAAVVLGIAASALGGITEQADAVANHGNYFHSSGVQSGHISGHASHASHGSHSSHGSHGSHGQW